MRQIRYGRLTMYGIDCGFFALRYAHMTINGVRVWVHHDGGIVGYDHEGD